MDDGVFTSAAIVYLLMGWMVIMAAGCLFAMLLVFAY